MAHEGDVHARSTPNVEIVVVVAHPAVRALVVALLEHADPSWSVTASASSPPVASRLPDDPPAVIVVDAGDVATCCRATFAAFPHERLIVIGPEPGRGYEQVARRIGVGAWLPRDEVADELPRLVRTAVTDGLVKAQAGGTG